MGKSATILSGFVAAILFAAPVHATTWYVRTSGNDGNVGTSAASAFRTISQAAWRVNPGDTVYVGAGTYVERVVISRSGTAGSTISFVADTTGQQTGDAGQVVVDINSTASECIDVYRASYIRLAGFRVTRSRTDGIVVDGGTGVRVEGCYGYANGGDGIDVRGTDCVVSGFRAYNNAKEGIQVYTATRATISGCLAYSNRGAAGIYIHGGGTATVYNCMSYANTADGVQINSGCEAVLYNNTFVSNGRCGLFVYSGVAKFWNNVLAYNQYGAALSRGVASGDYNLVWSNSLANYRGVAIGPHDKAVDPLFQNRGSNDYHLTKTSPAINAGRAASAPTVDYEGHARNAADGFVDTGADEFSGGTIRVMSWREVRR